MRPFLISLAVLATGCSTGRYDADYAKALSAYRDAAPFAVLQPQPVAFASSRVSMRLPRGFTEVVDGPPLVEGGPPVKPDPSRLRPPFLAELPGYQATHEQRFATDGAELQAAVAVGVLPASAGRAAIEKTLLEQARADESFKGDSQGWADRPVEPRDGGPRDWRVLTLVGPQVFESVVAGNPEYKRWDGTCEIWLSADPQQELITVLAWRVPEKAAGSLPVPLSQLAETVARTVAIGPAPAVPADGEVAAEPPPEAGKPAATP
jgi:hypothetical protein